MRLPSLSVSSRPPLRHCPNSRRALPDRRARPTSRMHGEGRRVTPRRRVALEWSRSSRVRFHAPSLSRKTRQHADAGQEHHYDPWRQLPNREEQETRERQRKIARRQDRTRKPHRVSTTPTNGPITSLPATGFGGDRPSFRSCSGMRLSGPRTGPSTRCRRRDYEGTSSTPGTAVAFPSPYTLQRWFVRHRCRA
jgi:hypothetical protein